MYKKNSQNQQGRASRITMKDLPAGNLTPDQLTSVHEERLLLGQRKQKISVRIAEIRKALGVKNDVSFKRIKGEITRTKEFREWVELAQHATEIETQLRNLPKTSKRSRASLMIQVLEEHYPEIYESCFRAAVDRANAENIIFEEFA